ncbi:hypothetical protein PV05_11890 [Exophiala xenobiotica]|uniref:Uncharacterized protein n=1 Tax=Exophiala xenobiotica TaxID=348802 RepID=A0A0D2E4A9_9EURO|nr:uncharacterized protein PV05_11890 [Exophiala xenobiotica]KIW50288.1 hypothetical protein PV05_11890 [Exophiala xenobiotica]
MDTFSSLPPFQYLVAYFIPIMLLGVFLGSLVSPHAICASACFPQPADKPMQTFFYLFAVRELCLGLALLTLEAYDEWRAATILLACIGINGVGDFLISGFQLGTAKGNGNGKSKGNAGASWWWSSFMIHGTPTIIGYWTVWKLWQEHF